MKRIYVVGTAGGCGYINDPAFADAAVAAFRENSKA